MFCWSNDADAFVEGTGYSVRDFTPEERAQVEEMILDFFAFQAAACTTQPDCACGRHGA